MERASGEQDLLARLRASRYTAPTYYGPVYLGYPYIPTTMDCATTAAPSAFSMTATMAAGGIKAAALRSFKKHRESSSQCRCSPSPWRSRY